MPTTLTKAQLEKLLVAERKKSALKNKNSKFMTRTGSIYNSQRARIRKEVQQELTYTLADLRALVQAAIDTPCPYSGAKITLANLAVDHATPISRGGSWGIDNLVVSTAVANFQKGMGTAAEWKKFYGGLRKNFDAAFVTDVLRRLSIGGKWSFK